MKIVEIQCLSLITGQAPKTSVFYPSLDQRLGNIYTNSNIYNIKSIVIVIKLLTMFSTGVLPITLLAFLVANFKSVEGMLILVRQESPGTYKLNLSPAGMTAVITIGDMVMSTPAPGATEMVYTGAPVDAMIKACVGAMCVTTDCSLPVQDPGKFCQIITRT